MNTKKAVANTSTKKKNTPEYKKENNANAGVNIESKNVNIVNTDVNNGNKDVNIVNTDANNPNTSELTPNTNSTEPAFTQSLQANATNTDTGHTEFLKGLQETISKPCQLSLRVNEADFSWWIEFRENYGTVSEAFSELLKLAQKTAEIVQVEKPIEVIKEVDKKLSPEQVIVTFGKETADKIRLCRPFIAQGNVLNYERGNDESFISALVNLSVNKTLERNFPQIIRRMNLKANG